jgi:hypothetical protein
VRLSAKQLKNLFGMLRLNVGHVSVISLTVKARMNLRTVFNLVSSNVGFQLDEDG